MFCIGLLFDLSTYLYFVISLIEMTIRHDVRHVMITFLIFLSIGIVQGLPGGARVEMIPRHPGTTPQQGTSPNFSTIPDKVVINVNQINNL